AVQLEGARAETATAKAMALDAQRELATTRLESQALGADLAAQQARLEALEMERDAVAGELERVRQILDARPTLPAADVEPHAAPGKDPAGDNEDWQAVRLAPRYVFDEAIEIRINAGPGLLIDLSA